MRGESLQKKENNNKIATVKTEGESGIRAKETISGLSTSNSDSRPRTPTVDLELLPFALFQGLSLDVS